MFERKSIVDVIKEKELKKEEENNDDNDDIPDLEDEPEAINNKEDNKDFK